MAKSKPIIKPNPILMIFSCFVLCKVSAWAFFETPVPDTIAPPILCWLGLGNVFDVELDLLFEDVSDDNLNSEAVFKPLVVVAKMMIGKLVEVPSIATVAEVPTDMI
jgi:hypothetical protein